MNYCCFGCAFIVAVIGAENPAVVAQSVYQILAGDKVFLSRKLRDKLS
jgi:hypothetical protein